MTDPEIQRRIDIAAAPNIREIHVDLRKGRKDILVPHVHEPEVVAEVVERTVEKIKRLAPRTPVCPACGAKFAHSEAEMRCQRCFIPDEIVDLGPKMIARWKKQQLKDKGASKREIKKGRQPKGRNKHGRKGVGNAKGNLHGRSRQKHGRELGSV